MFDLPQHARDALILLSCGTNLALLGFFKLLIPGLTLRWKLVVAAGSTATAVLAIDLAPQSGFLIFTITAGILALLAILDTDRFHRILVGLFGRVRQSALHFATLFLLGIGIVLGGIYRVTSHEAEIVNQDMKYLEQMVVEAPVPVGKQIPVKTDQGQTILVGIPESPRPAEVSLSIENEYLTRTNFGKSVINREPAYDASNCHGWVFTGGQYIVVGSTVETILNDNGYKTVPDPTPGDVVVYRGDSGVVIHTGIVRYVTPGMPVLVESKWGSLGVFLHPVEESCYGKTFDYYRSPRSGHVLKGIPPAGNNNPIRDAASTRLGG